MVNPNSSSTRICPERLIHIFKIMNHPANFSHGKNRLWIVSDFGDLHVSKIHFNTLEKLGLIERVKTGMYKKRYISEGNMKVYKIKREYICIKEIRRNNG